MSVTINGSGPVAGVNSINGGPLSVRNAIINGNFGINQRGVSGTVTLAAGVYGHDRWKAGAGGCTYTFATALNVTTITITAGTLVQVIEGLNLTSGTYTLSWSGTATARIDAGAYSSSGVTGTAVGGTNQSIEFAIGTVSKVQYEFGSVATPFEHRPYGMELALCQRYYEETGMILSTSITPAIQVGYWKSTKRAAPTLVVTNANGATVANLNINANSALSGVYQSGVATVLANSSVSGSSEL